MSHIHEVRGPTPKGEGVSSLEPIHPYPLVFLGSAREYFRIWIVNLFLTVVTLGIYAAWAKVRTRQYFYANTRLAGYQFDYLASPVAILKGNLIIGSGIVCYSIFNYFAPVYSLAVVGLYALILPYLIYKSLRFYTHNSAYRNIRFRFLGTLPECYKTYVVIPLIMLLAASPIIRFFLQRRYVTPPGVIFALVIVGLILPYWAYYRKRYFLHNTAYGTTVASFSGSEKPFYGFYFKAALLAVVIFLILVVSIVGIFTIFYPSTKAAQIQSNPPLGLIIMFMTVMFISFLLFQCILEYLKARVSNYVWAETLLGHVHFSSTLRARVLFWIQLTNVLAILFSAGFLIPWAKVRRIRYVLSKTFVHVPGSLDEFAAAFEVEDDAVGDSATDFFNLEIGF